MCAAPVAYLRDYEYGLFGSQHLELTKSSGDHFADTDATPNTLINMLRDGRASALRGRCFRASHQDYGTLKRVYISMQLLACMYNTGAISSVSNNRTPKECAGRSLTPRRPALCVRQCLRSLRPAR